MWFLVKNGHEPWDLMILGSYHEDGEDQDETHEPPKWRYSYFDWDVWDDSAGGEGSGGV